MVIALRLPFHLTPVSGEGGAGVGLGNSNIAKAIIWFSIIASEKEKICDQYDFLK